MLNSFKESLTKHDLETYARAIFNATSYDDVDRILFEISRYNKKLSKNLRDMWDNSASVPYNTDNLSSYLLLNKEEILNEDCTRSNTDQDVLNKNFIKESATEFYTTLIDSNPGPALQKFMNTDINNVTFDILHSAIKEFSEDYAKFPRNDLDIKYDGDKDRFYTKYREFADQCKQLKKILRPTGYGKTDFVDVRKKELCDIISNKFPYGWKVYKGAADRQVNEDYTKEDDEWGEPYTYDEVYEQLRKLTRNFKEKKGTVRCWYNQEKMFGCQILKDYYEDVDVSDAKSEDNDERYWVITYSHPKKED